MCSCEELSESAARSETYMKQPRPSKMNPKEDVMLSMETPNCCVRRTYPALASGDSAPSRLAAKVLQN